MGPLDALFAMRARNHQGYTNYARSHGQQPDELGEYLFNTRIGPMSRMRGHRLDSDGTFPEPIHMEEHPSHLTVRDWSNVTPDFVGPPRQAMTPRVFRSPDQTGPEPPTASPLAAMFK